MVIVLKADVRSDSPEVNAIVTLAATFPGVSTRVHVVQGATRSLTEIYLLGPTHAVPTAPFEEFEAVEKVVRITEKFRAIGRHGGQLESLGFEYNGVTFSQETLHVFPGLCAVDSREHVESTFRALAAHGIVTSACPAPTPAA